MNPTQPLHIFVRIAELASFTQAAESLGMPKASASVTMRTLEAQLGTRRLQRTTRRVSLTHDGQLFYERCKDLLADMEELQSMFHSSDGAKLRGRVRIDMASGVARNLVIPQLPALLSAHPLLDVEISTTERRVDLVREGFDCVLRAGTLGDSGLVARPLGELAMANCASPAYLRTHGTPQTTADLAQHQLVHYTSTLGARPLGFAYESPHGGTERIAMRGQVTVNNAQAYQAACLAGLGLIQVPRLGVQDLLDQGALVEVLPQLRARAMPLHLIYPHRRQLPRRVRVLMDWMAELVISHLEPVPKPSGVPPST
jgi:DNA-binding transcriptional LysR family regulator